MCEKAKVEAAQNLNKQGIYLIFDSVQNKPVNKKITSRITIFLLEY
jgi:hypothetical protein